MDQARGADGVCEDDGAADGRGGRSRAGLQLQHCRGVRASLWTVGAWGAVTVGMDGPVEEVPIPKGSVWNMVYDPDAEAGYVGSITHEELWRRLEAFLSEVIPVAEEAGVRLALHPDDPPMPTMRRQPRLVYQPGMYQRVIDLARARATRWSYAWARLLR